MVTRSGVTILLVTLFAVSDGKKRNFEETFRKCQENFECVHKSVCENFNRQLAEYKRTNNTEILTEIRSQICNKAKKAVCCRQATSLNSKSCGRPQKVPESIINGIKTAPGEFPFSGLIGYQNKTVIVLPNGRKITKYVDTWICSGVLISPRFLVTAAHCKKKNLAKFTVALGVLHLSMNLDYNKRRLPAVQKFEVNDWDFVAHKDYERYRQDGRLTVVNDIGLIKLPRAAQFNQLTQPICLGPIPTNTQGEPVVVGWGKTDPDQLSLSENGVYSNDQLKLKVPEVPLATCQEQLSVDSTHVCAGAELGKDACSGDSGGGLFIEDSSHTWHLLGIVSYGARECGNGVPGVYTRVSSFLNWIYATRAAME